MGEIKRTKRIRKQTAVLLTAIAEIVKGEETRLASCVNDPTMRQQLEKDLAFHRSLLNTTTDQYGTAKMPKEKTKSQGTRLIRVGCPTCGYTIRMAYMWISCALPVCPNPDCKDKGKPFEVDNPEMNQPFQAFEPETAPQKKTETKRDPFFERMEKESEDWLRGKP